MQSISGNFECLKCIKIPLLPFIGLIIDIDCDERKDIKIIKYDCDIKEICCFVGTY